MEQKTLEYNEVVQMGKRFLITNKFHQPQAMLIDDKGAITIILLAMRNDQDKLPAIEALRQMVAKNKVNKYYLTMVSWFANIKETTRMLPASQQPNRREALIVIEFIKGDNGSYGKFPFRRENNNIIFEDDSSIGTTKELVSLWNVFLEAEGTKERLDKALKKSKDIYRGRQ